MSANLTAAKLKVLFSLFILMIILVTISACNLDIRSLEKALETTKSSSKQAQKIIEFTAHLSSPLSEGENLALDMVDELRGISNNILRYHMTKYNNDLTYKVVISGMEDTILTYRYTKVGEISSSETNSGGNLVRYRMAYFSGDLYIDDIISGWSIGDYKGLTGNLMGRIIDKDTKLPVPDVLICVAGRQFFSNANGHFVLPDIPEGTHNLVGASIDGAYQVFQQQVDVVNGEQTYAFIELEPNQKIHVKFDVTTPSLGETQTIRIGGSIYQMGNTFTDLNKDLSLQSARMPSLTQINPQRYQLEMELFAGSEIRYFYSLGDGFWNVEQGLETISGYRQIVLPQKDVTIKDTVANWQLDGIKPIQFSFSAPIDTPENDTVSIQFRTDGWFEAIPMEKEQNNQWLFTLYSPLASAMNLSYRFCRNNICDNLAETQQELTLIDLPLSNIISVTSQLTHWKAYQAYDKPTKIVAKDIQKKNENYLTGVEFSPEFSPSHISMISYTLDELAYKGVNTIILQPTLSVETSGTAPVFYHQPGIDMLTHELEKIINDTTQRNLSIIFMPTINYEAGSIPLGEWKESKFYSDLRFAYLDTMVSYAQFAEINYMTKFILNPSSIFEIMTDGFDNNSAAHSEDFWVEIINRCQEVFSGEIIWAIPYSQIDADNSKIFNSADAIYIILDQPLASSREAEFYIDNKIAASLMLRSKISEIDQSNKKPIYIGISYPSDTELISGCNSNRQSYCVDYSPTSFETPLVIDGQAQVDYYNALLSEIITCPYIDGVISRSFFYPMQLTDQSSSIYGKPTMDVLWYWYTGIK